ncbi:hypothetical protein GCK32_013077 [Trichostrongylus colubriformis]|uniref:Uncharacterized protein n=1 Tax=Trichostrongylus colubriformis TaxID=6319 RepID=A0AAN8EY85_TRICO
MGGAQSELKPAGDAKSAKRSERSTATTPHLAVSKTSKPQVDTKKAAGKPSKPDEEKSTLLDLTKTAKQLVHFGGKSPFTKVAEQLKTAREVSPRTKSSGKTDIAQMKTAKDVSPRSKHSSTRDVAQPKTAKEVSPRSKPSDKVEIAQAKTAKQFVWPSAKPSIAAELDQTKTAKECYFESRAKEHAKAAKEPKRQDPKLVSLKTAREHKHRRPAEEATAREPSAKAVKEAKRKGSSAEAVATAQEMSAKTAKDFKALRPKPSAVLAQNKKEVATSKPAPQKSSGAPVVAKPKPSGGAQVTSSAAPTAQTTDAKKEVVVQKLSPAPVAATAGVLPRTSPDTRIGTAPAAASSPAMDAAQAKNVKKEVVAQKPSPAPVAATVGSLPGDPSATRITSPAQEPVKPVASQAPATKKDVPPTKPLVAQVTGDVPRTPEAKEAALPAGSSPNVNVNTAKSPKPSGGEEKVQEKVFVTYYIKKHN